MKFKSKQLPHFSKLDFWMRNSVSSVLRTLSLVHVPWPIQPPMIITIIETTHTLSPCFRFSHVINSFYQIHAWEYWLLQLVRCLSLTSRWCCQWDNHQKEKTCFSCEPDAVWRFAVTGESHFVSASDLKWCSQRFKNDLFFLMLLVECWTACWWWSESQSAPYL